MPEIKLKARLQNKYETLDEWNKLVKGEFIPLKGEVCYGIDNNILYQKLGDGETDFTDLPWLLNQGDWNESNENSPTFIKNKIGYRKFDTEKSLMYSYDVTQNEYPNFEIVGAEEDMGTIAIMTDYFDKSSNLDIDIYVDDETTPEVSLKDFNIVKSVFVEDSIFYYAGNVYPLAILLLEATEEILQEMGIEKTEDNYGFICVDEVDAFGCYIWTEKVATSYYKLDMYSYNSTIIPIPQEFLDIDYDQFVGRFDENDNYGEIFNDYTRNKATGNYAHAEGSDTRAYGSYSHAEGWGGENSYQFDAIKSIQNYGIYTSVPQELVDTSSQKYRLTYYVNDELKEHKGTIRYFRSDEIYTQEQIPQDIVAPFTLYLSTGAMNLTSHSEGQNTLANDAYTHAEGYKTQAYGNASHSEGWNTIVKEDYGHAEGYKTQAIQTAAHSEGQETKATGKYSHSEGYNTEAQGEAAHSEGWNTSTNSAHSHIEGSSNQIIDSDSKGAHIEGYNRTGSGLGAHIEGSGALPYFSATFTDGTHFTISLSEHKAYFYNSLGNFTYITIKTTSDSAKKYKISSRSLSSLTSDPIASFVLEEDTGRTGSATVYFWGQQSSGAGIHVEGQSTYGSGAGAHIEGQGTLGYGDATHVQGRYNDFELTTTLGNTPIVKNNQYAHVVGNGTSQIKRSNAHTLDWNGNAWYAGRISAEGIDFNMPTQNPNSVWKVIEKETPEFKIANAGEYIIKNQNLCHINPNGDYSSDFDGTPIIDCVEDEEGTISLEIFNTDYTYLGKVTDYYDLPPGNYIVGINVLELDSQSENKYIKFGLRYGKKERIQLKLGLNYIITTKEAAPNYSYDSSEYIDLERVYSSDIIKMKFKPFIYPIEYFNTDELEYISPESITINCQANDVIKFSNYTFTNKILYKHYESDKPDVYGAEKFAIYSNSLSGFSPQINNEIINNYSNKTNKFIINLQHLTTYDQKIDVFKSEQDDAFKGSLTLKVKLGERAADTEDNWTYRFLDPKLNQFLDSIHKTEVNYNNILGTGIKNRILTISDAKFINKTNKWSVTPKDLELILGTHTTISSFKNEEIRIDKEIVDSKEILYLNFSFSYEATQADNIAKNYATQLTNSDIFMFELPNPYNYISLI